jgi:Tim17/Tim22/Tim23/Pmp24 family
MAYGFGLVLGAFLNVHATDPIDYDLHRGVRSRTRVSMIEYWNRVKRNGKGFASFGFFFAAYDTVFERLRHRQDRYNDFWSGGLTAATLALDSGMGIRGLCTTGIVGGSFCYIMDYAMEGIF